MSKQKRVRPEDMQAQADLFWSDYQRVNSVHKVAEIHGITGETVRRRLKSFGYRLNGEKFSKEDDALIIKHYTENLEHFDLDKLTRLLGRKQKTNVSRRARELGVSDICRPVAEQHYETFSKAGKARIKKYGHPKGYLGHTHSAETREKLSEKSQAAADKRTPEQQMAINVKQVKTKMARGNLYSKHNKCSWKQQWAEFGGKRNYYRSQWELNYARYLEMLKSLGEIKEWEHEPDTFWFEGVKRGTTSYLPDFKVTESDGSIAYHEVKGWMDAKSKTKIRRMAKYHPDVKLIVIDSKAYKALERQVKGLVDGWI